MGYLWSRLRPYLGRDARPVLHTPTAVLGVRGTGFDTVVAEDSSSAIVVDEGAVEITTEQATLMLNQGQSTEVDPNEKIGQPGKAIPKKMRDWQKFRREKVRRLIQHLPGDSQLIRKRFERDMNRYLRFTRQISSH